MTDRAMCAICGSDLDVELTLIEWVTPVDGLRFENGYRCRERRACRERVEVVLREPWPVRDRTPAPDVMTPYKPGMYR